MVTGAQEFFKAYKIHMDVLIFVSLISVIHRTKCTLPNHDYTALNQFLLSHNLTLTKAV